MNQIVSARSEGVRTANTPDSAFLRRLEAFAPLNDEERRAVLAAISPARRLRPREELVGEADPPEGMAVLLSGAACRSRLLPDGRRQIVAFLVPGDFCDMHVGLLKRMDHSISSITAASVAILGAEAIAELSDRYPRIRMALRWGRLVEEAVSREWLVNLGQRTAFERTGALLAEFYLRLAAVGLARNGQCDFPFTQSELAETLGLSAVHINRTLQELRRQGLIRLSERRLTILDLQSLMRAAMYDPAYLHFDQRRGGILAVPNAG